MPVVPVCRFDPVWEQFAALRPVHPAVTPSHPLGCHRQRVPDRIVFDQVVAALVHGSGYERIATTGFASEDIEIGLVARGHAVGEDGPVPGDGATNRALADTQYTAAALAGSPLAAVSTLSAVHCRVRLTIASRSIAENNCRRKLGPECVK